MNYFYWDASALAKIVIVEVGSDLVNHLFASASVERMMALYLGVGEVWSVLVRRRNTGVLSERALRNGASRLGTDVVDAADFQLHTATDALVRASFDLIELYSINATDALVLRSALEAASELRSEGDDLVLIASDLRLLQAGRTEGLSIFNPETDSLQQLRAFVNN